MMSQNTKLNHVISYDIIVDVLGEYDAISYCRGNVLKYMLHRLWNKGDPIENARKAQWYLQKMIELMRKSVFWLC